MFVALIDQCEALHRIHAILDEINQSARHLKTWEEIHNCVIQKAAIESVWWIIMGMPEVDYMAIRHAHWTDKGSLSCRCSACGCKNGKEQKFCPNCGAKMDEKEDAHATD